MRQENLHVSDQDLLLAADAEMIPTRLAEVRAHLAACDSCRARMRKLERTSCDVGFALRQDAENVLPDPARARAALRARLASPPQRAWHFRPLYRRTENFFEARQWVFNAAVILIAIFGIALTYRQVWLTKSSGMMAQVQAASLPRPNLTPGSAQGDPVELCLVNPKEDPSAIPVSERKEVFREYGMDYRRAGQYELDHLITPALGGTNDIRNLWPEPYSSTEWNAHIKDELEDLLHRMVCSGQIDLPTAQHDIATNWIAAYKRYFRTDKPLAHYSVTKQDDDDASPKS